MQRIFCPAVFSKQIYIHCNDKNWLESVVLFILNLVVSHQSRSRTVKRMVATYFQRQLCGIIWYSLSGVSLFCSLITPYIIYKMRNFNGTLLLVVSLSSTLAIYSFGLLLSAINTSDVVCQLQGILIFYSGISSALWTTCFSTTLLMLVTGVKFGSIQQIFKYFAGVSIGTETVELHLLITATSLTSLLFPCRCSTGDHLHRFRFEVYIAWLSQLFRKVNGFDRLQRHLRPDHLRLRGVQLILFRILLEPNTTDGRVQVTHREGIKRGMFPYDLLPPGAELVLAIHLDTVL